MAYKIQARYRPIDNWGDWQAGTFSVLVQAQEYVARTVRRYRDEYHREAFEMRIIEVSAEEAERWNSLLNTILD